MSLTSIKDSAAAKARAALLSTASRKLPAKTVYPAIIRLHEKLDGERKEVSNLTPRRDRQLTLTSLFSVCSTSSTVRSVKARRSRSQRTTSRSSSSSSRFSTFDECTLLHCLSRFVSARATARTDVEQDITSIEENALGAFVQFILKLNETTFKPLFLRTYDWAVIDLADEDDASSKYSADLTARRTVLFKIVDRLLVQLKVCSPRS